MRFSSPRDHRRLALSTGGQLAGGLLLCGLLAATLLTSACRRSGQESRTEANLVTQQATVYRDSWGIPHIYAETAEAGLYASGWLQAEDRLEQVLKNYLLGTGEYAAAFGAGEDERWIRSDLESKMWDHYGTSKRFYEEKLNPELRSHIEAFVEGIVDFMEQHPEEVPDWWGERKVDRYMPVAYSRQFIWGWPAGQVRQDLRAIDVEPDFDVDARASNEIALAPSRTTFGAAALIIDPHLAWLGRQRYWEVRMHAGDIHISGFATAGFPYVNLGHNQHIAWAHTTGGPDTADVYELELESATADSGSDRGRRYRYDGAWRELTSRTVQLEIAGEETRSSTFWYSHHGPIVAITENDDGPDRAYAAAISYEDEIGYLESKYWFMIAEDYEGAIRALDVRQIMPQNVMVADTSGNIYYQRTGRVPIRPSGYDWSAPVDGTTSDTEWQGIHPVADLMSLLNPEGGAMQNCNIGPDTMLPNSPLTLESLERRGLPSYLYNQPANYTHQRGASAIDLIASQERFNEQELIEMALDRRVYQAERWTDQLDLALARQGPPSADAATLADSLGSWNHVANADSTAALFYYEWRHALGELLGADAAAALAKKIDDWLVLLREPKSSQPLSTTEQQQLVTALEIAGRTIRERHGSLDATFGDVFRVGRTDSNDQVSWPVGGGSLGNEGMATLRAIGFDPPRPDGRRWGNRGQTSTQVVFLTDPITSFTQPPIGQSDRPDSPHYRDQAEKLFSPARMKPAWFAKEELLDGNVLSERTIEYRPRVR